MAIQTQHAVLHRIHAHFEQLVLGADFLALVDQIRHIVQIDHGLLWHARGVCQKRRTHPHRDVCARAVAQFGNHGLFITWDQLLQGR